MYIANKWSVVHPRRRYAKIHSRGRARNQIDFIMVSNRFCNWIRKVKTFPDADLKIDHNPVVAMIKLDIKKISNARVMAKFLPELFIASET